MVEISKFSIKNPRFQALLARQNITSAEILEKVASILNDVRNNGDKALFRYMKEFDNINLDPSKIRVTEEEFEKAKNEVDNEFKTAIKEACNNLLKYHQHQLNKSYKVDYPDGVKLERVYKPVEHAGVTVPAGTAPLCSTLYMNLIPAIVAGVPEISIIAAPKNNTIDPSILYIADYLEIKKVYKISGAQGIAALAFGTESVPPVDIIAGPGNVYVQTAKRLVYGYVGIDSLAGPSEIAVIADDSANPEFIAADMLSQAEHGTGMEASIVFCLDKEKAEEIKNNLLRLIVKNDLEGAVSKSLRSYGNIFIVESLEEAVNAVNIIAPEHAEILTLDPEELIPYITNAGAVFAGEYSPEPVGDYYCGTNHILPTGGTARFSSGLSVHDFIRSHSVIRYTKNALSKHKKSIIKLAETEGMNAHALSIKVRSKE
jgi:histidinol dehydrogenase